MNAVQPVSDSFRDSRFPASPDYMEPGNLAWPLLFDRCPHGDEPAFVVGVESMTVEQIAEMRSELRSMAEEFSQGFVRRMAALDAREAELTPLPLLGVA